MVSFSLLDEFKATVWRQARVPDREPLPSFPGGVPYLPAAPAGPRGPQAHGGGAHQSFNYALFDDAGISWWVVDAAADTGLERALDALVPQWIAAAWPFTQPRYIGRDLSWADWLTLPPS